MTDRKDGDQIDDVEPADEDFEDAKAEEAEDTEPVDAADTDAWETTAAPESAAVPGPRASDRAEERRAIARDLATRTPSTDELPYIDDRFSKVWVALIVATFAGILIFALLFGKAGFFTPQPPTEPPVTPSPIVSISPSPSATVAPSVSPTPGLSASPSPAPSASPTPVNTHEGATRPPSLTPSVSPGPT